MRGRPLAATRTRDVHLSIEASTWDAIRAQDWASFSAVASAMFRIFEDTSAHEQQVVLPDGRTLFMRLEASEQ
jgi:hypothetical protein